MIHKDRSCNDCIKKSVCYAVGNNTERAQTCNEYLNKDSVNISPIKVNQTIYVPMDNEIIEYIVYSVNFDHTGNYITARLSGYDNYYPQNFDLNDFGKIFFNTPYEAKTYKGRIENV